MESELRRSTLVKLLDEKDKIETLIAKRNGTLYVLNREIGDIQRGMEVLSARIDRAQAGFQDKENRRVWLRLTKQKISTKNKLSQLLIKLKFETEEKTELEIKQSKVISEINRVMELLRGDSE